MHAILPSDPIQLRLVAATLLARIDAQEAAAVVQQEALAERDAELARRAALIYSLLETAKLNGLEPYAWLRDVLETLPTWPAARIDELLPFKRAT